jgi:hypothetical protein
VPDSDRVSRAGRDVHPREELLQAEGLDDVVGGAPLQPGEDVALLAPRGQHDHRDRAERWIGLEAREDREPVQHRHHHVEDDDVRGLAGRLGRGRFAVHDPDDLVPGVGELEGDHVVIPRRSPRQEPRPGAEADECFQ